MREPPRQGSLALFCTALILLSLVAGCTKESRRAPVSAVRVFNPPPPPTTPGCYRYSAASSGQMDHRWVRDKCLSQQEAAQIPRSTIGGNSGVYGVSAPCSGSCDVNPTSLITAGSVSVVFPGACPGGVCSTPAPIYLETDSLTGQNASFSVQLNSNPFTISCKTGESNCVAMDTGAVQFAYQASTGTGLFGWGGHIGALHQAGRRDTAELPPTNVYERAVSVEWKQYLARRRGA